MDFSTLMISLLFIIGGSFILVLGIKGFSKDRTKLFIKRCVKQTDGIIDGFDENKILIRKKREYYYYEKYQKTRIKEIKYTAPIVKFMVDNVEHRATYFRPMEKNLNIGQKVNIQFNPENPYEYIIIGDKYLHTNSMSAQATGILLILFGIGFLLLKLGVIKL